MFPSSDRSGIVDRNISDPHQTQIFLPGHSSGLYTAFQAGPHNHVIVLQGNICVGDLGRAPGFIRGFSSVQLQHHRSPPRRTVPMPVLVQDPIPAVGVLCTNLQEHQSWSRSPFSKRQMTKCSVTGLIPLRRSTNGRSLVLPATVCAACAAHELPLCRLCKSGKPSR